MSKRVKKDDTMRVDLGHFVSHQMLDDQPISRAFLGLACVGQIAYIDFMMRADEMLPGSGALARVGELRVEYENAVLEAATVVMFGVGQELDGEVANAAGMTLDQAYAMADEKASEFLALADSLERALPALAPLDAGFETTDPLGDLAAMWPSPLGSVALFVVAGINLGYPQLLLTWVGTENIDYAWLPRFVTVCAAVARLAAESLREGVRA